MYPSRKGSGRRVEIAAATALTAAIVAVGAILPLYGVAVAVLLDRRRHPHRV